MTTFPFTVAPDWGLSDQIEADVEEQKLGDGYVLRRPKGINYLRESWSPNWSHLDRQESIDMFQWLRERLNLKTFMWEHPETLTTHRVICTRVTRTASDVGIYRIQASFTKDFNV